MTSRPGRPSADELQRLYGHGYYHGETSGYPSQGYASGRPDWTAWLDLIRHLAPQGTLLDLGCAYGYLPAQARGLGYSAFGLDISSYALRQEPGLRGGLAQACLQDLPLADGLADVVTMFDVLEHLHDPLPALSEAARILSREGILVGATPDPLFFGRQEETHFCERPPSFWIHALERLGLRAAFRFSVEAYNFQFLAGFPGPETERRLRLFQHDYFEDKPDIVQAPPSLTAVPRSGWSALGGEGRSIEGESASIYLLNRADHPWRVRVRLRVRSGGYGLLRALCNSAVIGELASGAEPVGETLDLDEFLLPSGGHHLVFEARPPGFDCTLGRIDIEAQPASPWELAEQAPFDLYQRYRAAGLLAQRLKPRSILDYGGMLGDSGGHIAVSRDFLAPSDDAVEVRSSDIRQCDHPHHLPSALGEGGLDGLEFDLVVSLDVLEHLPDEARASYLEELDRLARRWIVLGAPFASEATEAAEARLRKGLMAARRFLLEHELYGLPQTQLVERFCSRRGYQLLAFPNGWLPGWIESQALTQHYFSFDRHSIASRFNRLCNRLLFGWDLREPAYRTIFLISKQPLGQGQARELSQSMQPSPDGRPLLAEDEGFIELQEQAAGLLEERRERGLAACFLVNEREKHIRLLQATAAELERLNEEPLHKIAKRRLRKRL